MPLAFSAETSEEENWPQYFFPSPDLISTVSIPRACALAAIRPTLPPAERLTYQIHIPSPASGFFACSGTGCASCAATFPPSGPATSSIATAEAARQPRTVLCL